MGYLIRGASWVIRLVLTVLLWLLLAALLLLCLVAGLVRLVVCHPKRKQTNKTVHQLKICWLIIQIDYYIPFPKLSSTKFTYSIWIKLTKLLHQSKICWLIIQIDCYIPLSKLSSTKFTCSINLDEIDKAFTFLFCKNVVKNKQETLSRVFFSLVFILLYMRLSTTNGL